MFKQKELPFEVDKKWLNKQLFSITCDCHRRKTQEKRRVKYGVCLCDTFSMSSTLSKVISNYMYQYVYDAYPKIMREDWDVILKHADNIRDFILHGDDVGISANQYRIKKRRLKAALKFIFDNFENLWW